MSALPEARIHYLAHVQGRPTHAALLELGERFELHSLALEDISNFGQRPKVDGYDGQLFVVMILPLMKESTVNVGQVSIFLNENSLISFDLIRDDTYIYLRDCYDHTVQVMDLLEPIGK